MRSIESGVYQNLLVCPTGSGKTIIATELRNQMWALRPHLKLMFLVSREELVWQAHEKFQKHCNGAWVGVEKADFVACPQTHQVVVASVQTLSRSHRMEKFNPEEYWCITDEAHHSTSRQHLKIYDYFRVLPSQDTNRPHVGITATPNRTDGQGLNKVYRTIAYSKSMMDLMQDGIRFTNGDLYPYITDFVAWKVQTETDISSVRTTQGDLDIVQLSTKTNTPERNELVARKYRHLGEGLPAIAFVSDVQHAHDMAAEFNRQGVEAHEIWGAMPPKDRQDLVRRYKMGDFPVVVSCNALNEGFDAERASVALLSRPTKSALLLQQQIGRVSRPFPSPEAYLESLRSTGAGTFWVKPHAVVIDFQDQCGKLDICRLPSLFGLPGNFSLQGRPIIKVVERLRQLELENPGFEVDEITNEAEIPRMLRAHVERLDLFGGHIAAEELRSISRMSWIKSGSGFSLSVPSLHAIFQVSRNLVGQWDLFRSSSGQRVSMGSHPSLEMAVRVADRQVPLEDLAITRTGMRWTGLSPTLKQVNYIWNLSYAVRRGFKSAAHLHRHFCKLNRNGQHRYSRGGCKSMIEYLLSRNQGAQKRQA
jgi:superfamily II DNA or RNA helicase